MNSLTVSSYQLPDTIEDLSRFVLIGREKLVAVRAEIRAIDRVGLARDVREQKLAEAQDIAEAVLDAEVKLGELISKLPKTQGRRSDLKPGPNAGTKLMSKREVVERAGFSKSQGERFELLAKHPDVVEKMKILAREQDDIISRTAVLQAIANQRPAYIVNNSHDAEWYTPEWIIESVRHVMGSIDLDPASCEDANLRIKATQYYSRDDDAFQHKWTGNVYLNPPYTGIEKFITKLCESDIHQAIVLCNNATETRWFKRVIMEKATAIVFLTGRLHFVRSDSREVGAPMQGQCLIYIGDNTEAFLREFKCHGWGAILH